MCLQKIQPTISLSHTIPRSMSARYQYGITVADACKVRLVVVYKYVIPMYNVYKNIQLNVYTYFLF